MTTDTSKEVLEQLCAEAYIVIGALAGALNLLDTPPVDKILDNLSVLKLAHEDVLPFKDPGELKQIGYWFNGPLTNEVVLCAESELSARKGKILNKNFEDPDDLTATPVYVKMYRGGCFKDVS